MAAYCDLHIHSCLSPCADDDMTPWNLVGMARVKGLDVIALTDHNTARNTPEAMAAGEAYGVQVIPGMEISSREEVHILGYFSSVAEALAAGEAVYAHLPQVLNQPALFGNQIIIGADDSPTGTLEKLLINATDLSVEEVCALVRAFGGVPVPAHINRGANGMIGALGLMPFLPDHPGRGGLSRRPLSGLCNKGSLCHPLQRCAPPGGYTGTHLFTGHTSYGAGCNAPAQGAGRPPDTPKRHLTR